MNKLRRLPRWRETEAGQSLVEFAMVLPVFLLLLFGMVDFGRGFYTWLVVTNAAREGARAAAVQGDWNMVQNKMYDSFCTVGGPPASGCSLDLARFNAPVPGNLQGARGEEVTVNVSYDFAYVTPIGAIARLVGGSTLGTPTITASSSMRLE